MAAVFKILNHTCTHTIWDKNCTWIAGVGVSYRNTKLNPICKNSSDFWETLSQWKISIIPKFQNIAKIQFGDLVKFRQITMFRSQTIWLNHSHRLEKILN